MGGRRPWLLSILAVASLWLAACGGGKKAPTASSTSTPPSSPEPITSQLLVTATDLQGGCKQDQESQALRNVITRTFTCSGIDILRVSVTRYDSPDAAAKAHGSTWGIMDGARDVITQAVKLRPVNPDSINVNDVTSVMGKAGAERENFYCVTYTDQAGVERRVEYYGALQQGLATIAVSAVSPIGTCEGPSPAQDFVRIASRLQLHKLKTVLGSP